MLPETSYVCVDDSMQQVYEVSMFISIPCEKQKCVQNAEVTYLSEITERERVAARIWIIKEGSDNLEG